MLHQSFVQLVVEIVVEIVFYFVNLRLGEQALEHLRVPSLIRFLQVELLQLVHVLIFDQGLGGPRRRGGAGFLENDGKVMGNHDVLEAFEKSFHPFLARQPVFSDLRFFHGDPVAHIAVFVLLEVRIEPPEQVGVDVVEQLLEATASELLGLLFKPIHEVHLVVFADFESVLQNVFAVLQN